jgi:hypothetical protein
MNCVSPVSLCLLGALLVCAPCQAQQAGPVTIIIEPAPWEVPVGGPNGCRPAVGCCPRHGCPDDYCPNPYPRQCWPPYPPFYRCVPAGDCTPRKDRLTWWFIPAPRALREALWWQP